MNQLEIVHKKISTSNKNQKKEQVDFYRKKSGPLSQVDGFIDWKTLIFFI